MIKRKAAFSEYRDLEQSYASAAKSLALKNFTKIQAKVESNSLPERAKSPKTKETGGSILHNLFPQKGVAES